MTSHWKAVCGVILVFILGCISGWIGASVVHYRQTTLFLQGGPEAVAKLLESRMTRNLNLDDNQKQQVHQYFLQNLEQRKEVQAGIQPQLQMLNRETFQQINAVLRPEQRTLFRQNIALFRQRTGKNPLNTNPALDSMSIPAPKADGVGTNSENPPAGQ